jgi:hypothetical protein
MLMGNFIKSERELSLQVDLVWSASVITVVLFNVILKTAPLKLLYFSE